MHSAAAGEQPLAFIIYELVGEPGAASHASVGVIDAIHLPLSSEHAIAAALGLTIGILADETMPTALGLHD